MIFIKWNSKKFFSPGHWECPEKLTQPNMKKVTKYCCHKHNYKYTYIQNREDEEFKEKRKVRMNEWYERNREQHIVRVRAYQKKRWRKFKEMEELKKQ